MDRERLIFGSWLYRSSFRRPGFAKGDDPKAGPAFVSQG